ncbi:hypothetical protein [Streptomyces cucumeris]|uniref:hypothetical protein n=1 Tax=Streptomyces cucumeris TaxID=2962890 RepID=UPI0020C8BEE5|nr:hypothetical protein [Streptomyces sp. NEAU-Y11]MCP9209549.1 hypothetical protein [Streptomyces sp. NEAU-Y11]
MAYVLEIRQRVISGYAKECRFADEDGHTTDGTGPECNGECRWLDGGVREIEDRGTSEIAMDDDDLEEHGSPVAWAAWYLTKNHPEITESSAGMTETFDAQWRNHVPDHAWLSGSSEEPYNSEIETETTVRVTGEFDTNQRSKVFALAVLPYDRMTRELRERNEGD